MRRLLRIGVVAAIATGALIGAGTAQAKPNYRDGYPVFSSEGRYPTKSCGYRVARDERAGSIRVRLFTSRRCGLAYARIDNAPRGCSAALDRWWVGQPAGTWGAVWEPVDPGINYAYTQVGYFRSHSEARAALVCNGHVVHRTGWVKA